MDLVTSSYTSTEQKKCGWVRISTVFETLMLPLKYIHTHINIYMHTHTCRHEIERIGLTHIHLFFHSLILPTIIGEIGLPPSGCAVCGDEDNWLFTIVVSEEAKTNTIGWTLLGYVVQQWTELSASLAERSHWGLSQVERHWFFWVARANFIQFSGTIITQIPGFLHWWLKSRSPF